MRISSVRGFTVLEILLVVTAIAILSGIVFIAVNPGRQLSEMRNEQRRTDVGTILNAIEQYQLRTGALPAALRTGTCGETEAHEVCAMGNSDCSALTDLSALTDDQAYLIAIPTDPSGAISGSGGCGYMVAVDANGRVTACALRAELNETISITQP